MVVGLVGSSGNGSPYLVDAADPTAPLHLADGDCRALCDAATAGHPTPPDPIGRLLCRRCVGVSLRAEADRVDPQVSR